MLVHISGASTPLHVTIDHFILHMCVTVLEVTAALKEMMMYRAQVLYRCYKTTAGEIWSEKQKLYFRKKHLLDEVTRWSVCSGWVSGVMSVYIGARTVVRIV